MAAALLASGCSTGRFASENADAYLRWTKSNVSKQVQPGYCHVIVRLPLGDFTSGQMRVLADLAEWATTIVKLPAADNLQRLSAKLIAAQEEALAVVHSADAGLPLIVVFVFLWTVYARSHPSCSSSAER